MGAPGPAISLWGVRRLLDLGPPIDQPCPEILLHRIFELPAPRKARSRPFACRRVPDSRPAQLPSGVIPVSHSRILDAFLLFHFFHVLPAFNSSFLSFGSGEMRTRLESRSHLRNIPAIRWKLCLGFWVGLRVEEWPVGEGETLVPGWVVVSWERN